MKAEVVIREFERGWGVKISDVKEFISMDDAWLFYANFNAQNDKQEVPPIYWMADEPRPAKSP